ncbi:MAG: hypothetical protein ACRDIU_07380 [Actinomycetota bacterium]
MGNGGAYGEQPPQEVVEKVRDNPNPEMLDMGEAFDQTGREDEMEEIPEPQKPGPA